MRCRLIRPRASRRTLSVPGALLVALATTAATACSVEDEHQRALVQDAVGHVDFASLARTSSGGGAHELVDETLLPLASGAPWRVTYGKSEALASGGARMLPQAQQGRYALALACKRLEVEWERYDAFEIRARCAEPIDARLHFKVQRTGGRVLSHTIHVPLAPSAEPRDVRVELGPAFEWDGAIHSVELSCELGGATPFELHALRFVRRAWQSGGEPLGEDEAHDAATSNAPASHTAASNTAASSTAAPAPRLAHDIGLVARGQDCRRAWAADLGEVLEAAVDVAQDGVLALALSAADGLEPDGGMLRLSVEAATSTAPDAPFVARGAVELDSRTLVDRWQLVHFPLADRAGERVRLRIATNSLKGSLAGSRTGSLEGAHESALDPARAPSGASRSRILYGAPIVLGARPSDRRPNVLLVTLDTTRADVAPLAGWTPNLDRVAQRGLVFDNAYSTCNSTTASHASIHTGVLLSQHGALDNLHLLPGANHTLAEIFRARGWHTAAAVSAEHLNAGTGFGQGFDEFWNADEERHDGRRTVDGLLRYFDEWSRAPERPFFAWLHLFDAHTPYGPPPAELESFAAARGIALPPRAIDPPSAPVYADYPDVNRWAEGANNHAYLEALYKLGVAWADACLGRVLDDLERHGWLADTWIVVTADHGEALGEHECWYAHASLHGEVVHVPLVVAGPLVTRGARVAALASGLDVYPTLAKIAGEPPRAARLGVDLLELADGHTDPTRALYFQLERVQQSGFHTSEHHFIDTHSGPIVRMNGTREDEHGRRAPDFLTIEAGTALLYDNAADPLQLHDLSREHPELVRASRERLDPVDRQNDQAGVRFRVVSPEQLERLRQLGYVGGK